MSVDLTEPAHPRVKLRRVSTPQIVEPDSARMLPELREATTPFWTGGADGQLLILHCESCDRWVHPPTSTCPGCGGSPSPRPVSGRGTVFSFTVNEQQFNPDVDPPYTIAIVVLDEQDDLRLVTNIVDCEPDDLAIGMAVEVLFERNGDVYVPLFTPVD